MDTSQTCPCFERLTGQRSNVMKKRTYEGLDEGHPHPRFEVTTSPIAKRRRRNLFASIRIVSVCALGLMVLGSGCSSLPRSSSIRVSEVTLFGDLDCLRIETRSATYLYGKRGAGFASILDPEGHDWISYRHGGNALGEYRGLPKCGQPVKYFHCGYGFGQYTNTNPFTTAISRLAPDHLHLHSETRNGDAACDWDFFPTHATLTLLKIPGRYWFLYEGTPGGQLHPAEDFVIRPGGRKTPLTEPWTDAVPWMAFGAKETPFGLLCFAHQPSEPASYVSWPYKPEPDGGVNQMTVSGFGRLGWQDPKQHTPPLEKLPARFSITILPGATAENAEAALQLIKATSLKIP